MGMPDRDPERTGLHGSVGSVATERGTSVPARPWPLLPKFPTPGTSVDVEFILMKPRAQEKRNEGSRVPSVFQVRHDGGSKGKDADAEVGVLRLYLWAWGLR